MSDVLILDLASGTSFLGNRRDQVVEVVGDLVLETRWWVAVRPCFSALREERALPILQAVRYLT